MYTINLTFVKISFQKGSVFKISPKIWSKTIILVSNTQSQKCSGSISKRSTCTCNIDLNCKSIVVAKIKCDVTTQITMVILKICLAMNFIAKNG